jgi:carbonic anhydrase
MIDIVYRYDPNNPVAVVEPANANEARALLERGNATFSEVVNHDPSSGIYFERVIPVSADYLGARRPGEAVSEHQPFAIVVGCADARVPIELIFGQGANDLFVLRVAGHVLGDEVLGSIDFALMQLASSVRLIVVLGHSSCGAVTSAVDAFLEPASYLALAMHHHLRAIVNQIFPAVSISYRALVNTHGERARERAGFREAMIETAVAVNAAMVASTLRHQVESIGVVGVDVVFGVYDLETRHVGLPGYGTGEKRGLGLLSPPVDEAEFSAQAALLAGGERIASLLGL